MLSACKAITIGKSAPQLRFLETVAARCGFALIEGAATGDIPTPRSLISFVLVTIWLATTSFVALSTRSEVGAMMCASRRSSCSRTTATSKSILHYVHLGVNDIISRREKRDVLIQRLGAQLSQEHLYIETNDYFGPDRRRLEAGVHDNRRAGTSGHSRLYVRRFPDGGTRIMRHEIFPAARAGAVARV